MDYTQKEIDEIRKRLPFKAVVWDNNENSHEVIVEHVFNNGSCANNDTIWEYFKELKEPECVPFTAETIKPFRDEWVNYVGKDYRINIIGKSGCRIGDIVEAYEYLLENGATFADTGKPFGKEVVSCKETQKK